MLLNLTQYVKKIILVGNPCKIIDQSVKLLIIQFRLSLFFSINIKLFFKYCYCYCYCF